MRWPKLHFLFLCGVILFSPLSLSVAKADVTDTLASEGSSLSLASPLDIPPPSAYDLAKDGGSANMQFITEDHAFINQGIKSLLVLSLVIALAYLCLRLLKNFMDKTGFSSSGPQLRVISRVGLDQKTAVHIVQVNNRYFLIGANENAVSLLSELSSADVAIPEKTTTPAKAAFTLSETHKDE